MISHITAALLTVDFILYSQNDVKTLLCTIASTAAAYIFGRYAAIGRYSAPLAFCRIVLILGLYYNESYILLKYLCASYVTYLYHNMVTLRWLITSDIAWSMYVVCGVTLRFFDQFIKSPSNLIISLSSTQEGPLIVADSVAACTLIFGLGMHCLFPIIPKTQLKPNHQQHQYQTATVPIFRSLLELLYAASTGLCLYLFVFSKTFFKAFNQYPIDWLITTMLKPSGTSQQPLTLLLALYWLIAISLSAYLASRVAGPSESSSDLKIICRKIFHFASAFMFLPSLIYVHSDYFTFLAVSLPIVIGLLFIIEMCRNTLSSTNYLFEHIFSYYNLFIDHRDASQGIVLSHIYLLLGAAIPVWYFLSFSTTNNSSSLFATDQSSSSKILALSRYFGVISVCIGDSFGAIFGVYFGKHKWKASPIAAWLRDQPAAGNRSIEGSAAVLGSVFVSLLILFAATFSINELGFTEVISLLILSLVATLLEAFSQSNDNIMMPLAMVAVTCIMKHLKLF